MVCFYKLALNIEFKFDNFHISSGQQVLSMLSYKSPDFSSYKNVRSHSDASIIYVTEATIYQLSRRYSLRKRHKKSRKLLI